MAGEQEAQMRADIKRLTTQNELLLEDQCQLLAKNAEIEHQLREAQDDLEVMSEELKERRHYLVFQREELREARALLEKVSTDASAESAYVCVYDGLECVFCVRSDHQHQPECPLARICAFLAHEGNRAGE